MIFEKLMKMKLTVVVTTLCLAMTACDDTTDTIGTSLTNTQDLLNVVTDTFNITSRTIVADSVYTRNIYGYIGKMKDPETGAYVTGNFMSQLHLLKNFRFPDADSIVSKIDGLPVADSCEIRLLRSTFYGDSLSQMKLTMYELAKPMEENRIYYSNYDPLKEGYVREDGLKKSRSYTQSDLAYYDSSTNPLIRIKLNEPYTDKEGKTYKNYGTYLMQKYHEDNSLYKNSYTFNKKVCPGFYYQTTGGVGSMSRIEATQLVIYFRLHRNDSVYVASTSLLGTEEVLQNTTIENDRTALEQLAADNSCTYVKSPAGLFTELTLPVEQILAGHENDTLNAVKLELPRVNNNESDDPMFAIPTTLLMLPTDSLYSFFENNRLPDYKTSYLGSIYVTKSSSQVLTNAYHFDNIAGLISAMYESRKKGNTSENWNKVVLIPVTATYTTRSDNTQVLTKIVHQMDMTSTRLVGGSANPHAPLKVSVIYSKFD